MSGFVGFLIGVVTCVVILSICIVLFARWLDVLDEPHTWTGGDPDVVETPLLPLGEAPRVGDIWIGEDCNGGRIEMAVSRVELPLEFGNEWRVALGDDPFVAHLGWWYGQGWSEKDV